MKLEENDSNTKQIMMEVIIHNDGKQKNRLYCLINMQRGSHSSFIKPSVLSAGLCQGVYSPNISTNKWVTAVWM